MSELLIELRRANQVLDDLLETLSLSPLPSLDVTHDRLSRAFASILEVEQSLRKGMHRSDSVALKLELQDYRVRLARVRTLMPSLHASLLTERARLEAERAHLEAANAWADASKAAF